MMSQRKVRRIAGWIACYVSDDLLKHVVVADGRDLRGRTWKSSLPLFKAVLLGLLSGCKGMGEVEELTQALPKSVRRQLGIPRRVPDTTLRDFLCKLDPELLYRLVYVVGYDAWRRKALRQREDINIPFGVLSLDGKYPSIADTDAYQFLQVHHDETGEMTHGLVRTITSTLITSIGRPILGCVPVEGSTNEQGSFKKSFGDDVRIYGRLFRVVMYDAGAASEPNADAVIKAGKDYVFLIADPRWVMYQTVVLLLKDRTPDVVDEEIISSRQRIVRKLTMRSVTPTRKNVTLWQHTRTIFKLESEFYEDEQLTGTRTRYAVSSMSATELSPEQWLKLFILRWGVETCHQILDAEFEEDNRPWITKDAQGNLAVQILRRVAYTLMTLYKHVTLRCDDEREAPWRRFFEWVKDVLKWANPDDLEGLRTRRFAVPPALA
jgi:hypothetical protein